MESKPANTRVVELSSLSYADEQPPFLVIGVAVAIGFPDTPLTQRAICAAFTDDASAHEWAAEFKERASCPHEIMLQRVALDLPYPVGVAEIN